MAWEMRWRGWTAPEHWVLVEGLVCFSFIHLWILFVIKIWFFLTIPRHIYNVMFSLSRSHQVKSHWFFGREMALSFALYLDSGRYSLFIFLPQVDQIVKKFGKIRKNSEKNLENFGKIWEKFWKILEKKQEKKQGKKGGKFGKKRKIF